MYKNGAPPPYEPPPPPYAPPSYSQVVGGVIPTDTYTPRDRNETPIVTTLVVLGSESAHITCRYCHADIETSTKTEPGMIAYISGVVIALMGCWLGCCLIPCCIDECMDVYHYCPNCKACIGRKRR